MAPPLVLDMVFGVVKQAGGLIDVYSEIGMGTTFRTSLARLLAQEELPRRESTPQGP